MESEKDEFGIDEYGSVKNNIAGAALVRKCLEQDGAVVFPWSWDKVTGYIWLIAKDFSKIGVMPFGGNPSGRIYVGLYGRKCGHFSTYDINELYWEEKLGIDQAASVEWVKFWTMIWSEKADKQKDHPDLYD